MQTKTKANYKGFKIQIANEGGFFLYHQATNCHFSGIFETVKEAKTEINKIIAERNV